MKKATMLMHLSVAIALTFSSSVLAFAPYAAYPTPQTAAAGKQVVQEYKAGGNTWVYLLYLPPQYDAQPNRKWPVIVHHGTLGATSDDGPFANMFDSTKGDWSNGGLANHLQHPDQARFVSDSFIVVTPWLSFQELGSCITNNVAFYDTYFEGLYDHLFTTLRADPKRLHLEGYCFGGCVAYRYATMHPTYVASVTTWSVANANHDQACADLSKACTLNSVALQVLFGSGDTFIGVDLLTAFKDAISNCNASNLRWTSIDGPGGHMCWCFGYDTTHAIWDYILPKTSAVGYPVSPSSVSEPAQHQSIPNLRPISASDRVEVIGLSGRVVSTCARSAVTRLSRGVYLIRTLEGTKPLEKTFIAR